MDEFEMNKIYVSNIPYDTTEQELRDLCSEFGKVVSVAIPADKETQRIKGFAFVGFETDEEAKEARDTLDASMFKGRTLRVSFAKKRVDRRQDNRQGDRGRGNRR